MTQILTVGITGHQAREGADWGWARSEITHVLTEHSSLQRGYTCLAKGADQIFAEQALQHGLSVTAIIPIESYAKLFDPADREKYERLLSRCQAVQMPPQQDNESAFLKAGQAVADIAELVLAVWDGEPAAGRGGTADIVDYSLAMNKKVIQLNPITCETTLLVR